jgi:predicted transcriptional regulator
MPIMTSAKEKMLSVIEEQPEDSTFEEILRELAFARMVERGLADADQGRTLSNEEMAQRIASRKS